MSNIAFFLSSTFNDMQSERDLIRERITPEIEELLRKYGHNIEFIDLRWGIDTKDVDESTAGSKILKTCFDEIRKTLPFFIAFIGERYGWVPEQEYVDAVCRDSGLAGDDYFEKSVTELEIACAMHSYPFMDKCLFYFREPVDYGTDTAARDTFVSDAEHRKKLDALKERLRKKYPGRVHTYKADWNIAEQKIDNLDEFERQLLDDVRQCLAEELQTERARNRWEESSNIIDSTVSGLVFSFSGRTDEMERVDEFVRGDAARVMLLCGDSGCGKSSLMAKIVDTYNDDDHIVVPFFVGADGNTSTAESLLALSVYRLSHTLGVPLCFDPDGEIEDYATLAEQFSLLLNRASQQKRTVLVVDAINQFAATMYDERLKWLNLYALNPSVRVILSATTDYRQLKYVQALGASRLDLEYFSDEDISDVARRYFTVNHKELNDAVLQEIVHKGESANPCRQPIYLMSLLQDLNNIGREDFAAIKRRESEENEAAADAIVNYLRDAVRTSPDDLYAQIGKVFDKAAQKVGKEACEVFACAVAASRRGLSERFLERICHSIGCEFTTVTFSYFRKLFKNYLCQRENGTWDFSHNLVKSYFAARFEGSELYASAVRAAIDILTVEDNSDFKKSEFAHFAAKGNRLDLFVPYFAAHSSDITVRASLVGVTQQLQQTPQAVDALFNPITADSKAVWEFFIQSIQSGLYEPKSAEIYAQKVLCAIYSTDYAGDNDALRLITELYLALSSVAVTSGYYAVGRDYLHLARELAQKTNDTSLFYDVDSKLSVCYYALGNEVLRKKYHRLAERALQNRIDDVSRAEDVRLLLQIRYDDCLQKTESIFVRRKALDDSLQKMRDLLSQNKLEPQETALWYARILHVGTLISRKENGIFENAERVCRESLVSAQASTEKAEILYRLGVWQAEKDVDAADELLRQAHECVLEVLQGGEQIRTLALLDDVCEMQRGLENMRGNTAPDAEREQAEVLRKLNALQPTYSTLCRTLDYAKRGGTFAVSDIERASLVKQRRELAKGQVSAEQKAVNKILLLITVVVAALFVVIMPLFFSFFRVKALEIFSYHSAYSMFVNFYVQALFETFFNMFFCFGVYGLLQVFRIGNDYKLRSVWIKRCIVLFAAAAVVLIVYFAVWQYFEKRFLINGAKGDFLTWEIPFQTLQVCGFLLVAQLCNEVFTFITREMPVRPSARRYKRFVCEYRDKMLTYCVNFAVFACTALAYWLAARAFVPKGFLTNTEAPTLILPIVGFIAAASCMAAVMASKIIYLTAARFITKGKYAKKDTH